MEGCKKNYDTYPGNSNSTNTKTADIFQEKESHIDVYKTKIQPGNK